MGLSWAGVTSSRYPTVPVPKSEQEPFRIEDRLNLHDSSASHANNQHKRPAWDNIKCIQNVAHRHVDAKFRKLAVKRMEDTLVYGRLLPRLGGVDSNDVGRSRIRAQAEDTDSGSRTRLIGLCFGQEDVPDRWCTSCDCDAEYSLILAVQISHIRGGRFSG